MIFSHYMGAYCFVQHFKPSTIKKGVINYNEKVSSSQYSCKLHVTVAEDNGLITLIVTENDTRSICLLNPLTSLGCPGR